MTKEQVPFPIKPKLRVAVAIDYPHASDILVSFPDQWELIHQVRRADTPLYVAGLPVSQERPSRDQFYGLLPEVNLSLASYRLYKLFQPWPMPSVIVGFDAATGIGRVEKMGDLKVHL
jgi:hypothetical protein